MKCIEHIVKFLVEALIKYKRATANAMSTPWGIKILNFDINARHIEMAAAAPWRTIDNLMLGVSISKWHCIL